MIHINRIKEILELLKTETETQNMAKEQKYRLTSLINEALFELKRIDIDGMEKLVRDFEGIREKIEKWDFLE